ncbi:sensor domain-containing diguanylate cyclase [Sporosarcina trichiuri]|uniref:sensor domain-containing diguanylate cyclase n=1 Tax=Sporosarcina trichiuri TaxID=3056445 RepID=UPI0025B34A0E|nr:GGDEF domain-containing protein [Sporosarcina sp. 0.2-SM1T-5]WJY28165.1 GGDEF domain-containing protein [Sporosarcina sp. 0.2-SM1T-5]
MLDYPKRQFTAFALWLLVVPVAVWLVYDRFPFETVNYGFLSANFVMMLVALSMSFKVFSNSVPVERWIIFVVFFQYGLFAEMIFMQIALLTLQFLSKSSLPPLYRFSTNSLMFTLVSIFSAGMFYLAGGSTAEPTLWSFTFAAIIYAISYSLINSLIIFCMTKLEGESTENEWKLTIWDLATSLVFIPLAVAYSLLADQLGNYSLLLLGAPFLIILLIIKRFAFSGEFQEKLSSAVEMGHELTDSLLTDEVIEKFIEKIKHVVNYDQLYLLDVTKQKELKLLTCSEAGEIAENSHFFTCDPDSYHLMNAEKAVIHPTAKEIRKLTQFSFSNSVQSLLIAPVIRNGTTEGFLILTSFRKNFFEDLDKRMAELLTGYFETSIVKAYHYEKTLAVSERCGLTKLNNFRYLTKQMTREMDRIRSGELSDLSAIIMDIDHFKSINDTYGHQSGNDILVTFADILRKYETNDRTLARYGGEEFVLLLPDMTKDGAADLAERIRREVEETLFTIQPDLSKERKRIGIRLTVSLGVSSIPEDTDSESSLLRNADRALYIGGKQAGRNRVGIYEADRSKPIGI